MKELHSSLERIFHDLVIRNWVLTHVWEDHFSACWRLLDMSAWSMPQGIHWKALKANTSAVMGCEMGKKCYTTSAVFGRTFHSCQVENILKISHCIFFLLHNLFASTRSFDSSPAIVSMVHRWGKELKDLFGEFEWNCLKINFLKVKCLI